MNWSFIFGFPLPPTPPLLASPGLPRLSLGSNDSSVSIVTEPDIIHTLAI